MIVAIGSATVVVLVSWRLRPRPIPRVSVRRHAVSARWMLIVPAAIVVVIAPLVGLTTLIGAVMWRLSSTARGTARAARQISTDYPDALDLLVLSIRAGYLPAQAVVEIAQFLTPRLRRSFAAVDRAMQNGTRFADALAELPRHLGPITQPLVDSLSAADRYGLPLAPVLERLAFEARQHRRRRADSAARELPVRLAVPLVLCTLPSFILLAIVPLLLGALSSLGT